MARRLQLARAQRAADADERTAHVGYYLIGAGLPQLEALIRGADSPPTPPARRLPGRYAYLAPIALLTAAFTRGAGRAGLRQRRARLAAPAGRVPRVARRQPARRGAGELAGDPGGDAAAAAAHGLSPRASRRESRTLVVVPTLLSSTQNVDDLVEALEVRFLGQPRRPPALRPAHRLRRRRRRNPCRRTRRCSTWPQQRIAALNEKYRPRRSPGQRRLLPAPSPAPLEPARTRLDGLRAQARQAGGPERPAARRRPAAASRAPGRPDRRPRRRALRDHARHRHAAAARRGAPAGRHHGASAESPALRRSERPRHRRLRHPAAARGGEPGRARTVRAMRSCTATKPASTRTRARCPTSTRTCSAKARSSARASTTSTRSSGRSTGACRRTAS